jgi:hypothetical protein
MRSQHLIKISKAAVKKSKVPTPALICNIYFKKQIQQYSSLLTRRAIWIRWARQLKLVKRLLATRLVDHLKNVEAHSLGQATAFSNHNSVADINAK